jgi:hypothetical protein
MWFALELAELENSDVTIGGSPGDKISHINGDAAIFLIDIHSSTVDVSYLETDKAAGLAIMQGADAVWGLDLGPVPEQMPELSTVHFSNNKIRAGQGSWWAGIELYDLANYPVAWGGTGEPALKVYIADNEIDSPSPNYPYVPIFSDSVDGLDIGGNAISGGGGIVLWNTSGSTLEGNDYTGVTGLVGWAPPVNYNAVINPSWTGEAPAGTAAIKGNGNYVRESCEAFNYDATLPNHAQVVYFGVPAEMDCDSAYTREPKPFDDEDLMGILVEHKSRGRNP